MGPADLEKKLTALAYTGDRLRWLIRKGHTQEVLEAARKANPFFTAENVLFALEHIINYYLNARKLRTWIKRYVPAIYDAAPRNVGIVTAGNIPLVGFHDVLVAYLSPHSVQVKLSRNAPVLLPWVVDVMGYFDPEVHERIRFVDRLREFDAVIATGSNTSARYFEYYFRDYPRIIRHTRHSMAVLHADASDDELVRLGRDVFTYFGLGCRNVTLLWLPRGFDIERLRTAWHPQYARLMDHTKYANNYLYWKSIFSVDNIPHHDFEFVLLKEEEALSTGLGVLYYAWYDEVQQPRRFIKQHRDRIQCVVCSNLHFCRDPVIKVVSAGKAQLPSLRDYADGVDTLDFLIRLGRGEVTP